MIFKKVEKEVPIEDPKEDVVSLLEEILQEAIQLQASDIHFEMVEERLRIRYRMDGDLYTKRTFDKSYHSPFITRIKIISGMDIAEKRLPQDGRFSLKYEERLVDARVSSIPAIGGEKVVIRILDPIKFERSKEELGISPEDVGKIAQLLEYENGMLILVGPTGCGKTTTLYSLLRDLNEEKVNIVTIEDPVEYRMEGVNQIQIQEGIGLSFSHSLRSVLRQDPEIIMVGEIRDLDTAEIAVRSAITGHKILTTLHTNDAYSTIIRLIDMGIEPYLLKSSVNGIISQRLVKKLCPHCRIRRKANLKEEQILLRFNRDFEVYEAQGCPRCNEGYLGRIAIMEILTLDEDFLNLIDEKVDLSKLKDLGQKKGIASLIEKGLDYVEEGKTTLDEVFKLTCTE